MTKRPTVQLPASKIGVDVDALLWDGIDAGIQEGLGREAKKRGVMRGASQGLFLDMQTITGPCHRAALARMLGGEPERPADWASKHIMFDSGHANEDSWIANLSRTWVGDGKVIVREEEFPIAWQIKTDAGAEAEGSGRADIILCYLADEGDASAVVLPDGRRVTPVQGVELKQISSINTAMDTLFASGKPKLPHGIQAARYMKQVGCPWQIWYTLPFVLPIPGWSFILKEVPAQGDKFSEPVNYSKDGKPTKVQPTAVGYHLCFDDAGVLHYSRVGEEAEGWSSTIITTDGLDDFWKFTIDMPGYKDLGPRPKNMDIHGEREFWSLCSYCEWETVCNTHESNYDNWEAAVKARIPVLPK